MKTDKEHWKKMLPIIEAFVNGCTIEADVGDGWSMIGSHDGLSFGNDPSRYRIARPKERVPLEAEDWIKDGPWWVRNGTGDFDMAMVVHFDARTNIVSLAMSSEISQFNKEIHMSWERRNATSDWMPCWKEKE